MFRKLLLATLGALALAAPAVAGDDSREAKGAVSALSAASITVSPGGKDPLTCAVSDHSPSVAGVKLGDRVAISCKRIGSDLVLAQLKASDDKGKGAELKGKGAVTEALATVLSIKTEKGDLLSCLVPDRLADRVAKLKLGDKVGIFCKRGADGKPLLQALERTGKGDDHASREVVDFGGTVSAVSADSLTVKDGAHSLTCSVPDAFAAKVAALKVGDKVKMYCKGGALAGLARPEVHIEIVDIAGAVSAVSATSITVANAEHSRSLTCSVPDSLAEKVAVLKVGDKVKLYCKGGVLAGLARLETPKSETPPPAATEFVARGAITALSATAITVSTDGAPLTCRVPLSWGDKLHGFAVGDNVKLYCRGAVGNAEAVALEKVI